MNVFKIWKLQLLDEHLPLQWKGSAEQSCFLLDRIQRTCANGSRRAAKRTFDIFKDSLTSPNIDECFDVLFLLGRSNTVCPSGSDYSRKPITRQGKQDTKSLKINRMPDSSKPPRLIFSGDDARSFCDSYLFISRISLADYS